MILPAYVAWQADTIQIAQIGLYQPTGLGIVSWALYKVYKYRLRSAVWSFLSLKGPKLEIFGSGVFTQIRPVRVGDFGSRLKNPKLGWFRPENRQIILFSAVG